MRAVLVAVVALFLQTGCDRPEVPPPADPSPLPVAAPPAPAGDAPADGSFVDAAGTPTATLSCGSGELRIVVPGFRPIESEDRLSIGAEGEAFALVADLSAPGPGVTASGAPDPDLLNRLGRGAALFASYGQQSAGPLAATSSAGLQTVISACRRRK